MLWSFRDSRTSFPSAIPMVPTTTSPAYYNFPESQKIADGIYYIKAKGHTKGNSIIVVEMDGLFYMIHGDITYVDEALYEDKLSIVFDDLPAARETLNRVREFIRNHPTVYCGTHTPQGYENLEAKRVMDLDNPVSMTPQSTTVSPSKTCPMTGSVLVASSRRRSLIRRRKAEVPKYHKSQGIINLLWDLFCIFAAEFKR